MRHSEELAIMMLLAVLEFCLGTLLGITVARGYEAREREVPVGTVPAAAYDSCPDWGRHGY